MGIEGLASFHAKQHGTGMKDSTRYKITVKTEAVVCLTSLHVVVQGQELKEGERN